MQQLESLFKGDDAEAWAAAAGALLAGIDAGKKPREKAFADAPPFQPAPPAALAPRTWGPIELEQSAQNLRWISWTRPRQGRWPQVIEKAWHRLRAAAADPHSRLAQKLFPADSTPLPGRARDGRSKDQRQRAVQAPAIVNACNVLSVILGWSDLRSGIVAAPPAKGRGWEHKSWGDVQTVAFGPEDVPELLNREKRARRAIEKIAALGYIEITQIRKLEGGEWRSRVAVKRVSQALFAKLGLLREHLGTVAALNKARDAKAKAARERAAHAGDRARQALIQPTRRTDGRAGEPRQLPAMALELARKLGLRPPS